ncbi:MAG: hypothetical protein JWM78_58 [Verrucomicrobiaceae bacterium]|nr:hypothetical protein [Verrucomicrobiaceae bacterium]
MKSKSVQALIYATAAAALFTGGGVAAIHAQAEEAKVQCGGVTGCKGESDCMTATNACKGQNNCMGEGFKLLTKAECLKKGGKILDKK